METSAPLRTLLTSEDLRKDSSALQDTVRDLHGLGKACRLSVVAHRCKLCRLSGFEICSAGAEKESNNDSRNPTSKPRFDGLQDN